VVGCSALSPAESAQLSLASIREASSIADLEAAGRAIAADRGYEAASSVRPTSLRARSRSQ
jgi:hypothetical protein